MLPFHLQSPGSEVIALRMYLSIKNGYKRVSQVSGIVESGLLHE